ncbi:MAG TPA: hypothetical protein PKW98_07120 [Candidatus Wallbacteria bacterium]|nr:MAG: hypothetical protein BWY32_00959 [bacterium ADurb.Bin243]HOD39372.1 hypothetical protein [Candidatus Wallbacteria bacterium]HPG57571.1 hypothetical protein [Candidatus Wallbacteria bacterium]
MSNTSDINNIGEAKKESALVSYFKKFSIALMLCLLCAITFIHRYALELETLDMQIICAEEFYGKILPYSFIKSSVAAAEDKLDRSCEDIIILLRKNGIYDCRYCASIYTKEAVKLIGFNPVRSAALLNCAKKFSPGYQKAYFYHAILSIYNFDFAGALNNAASIFYFVFASPGAIFSTMNLALLALISFIIIQFIFIAALYLKYRRMIMHEAHEFEIGAANISITPYLDSRESFVSSALGKNIIICLMFVIFYCYFSTGFGKYLKLAVETNDFLKNPHEFQAINAMPIDNSAMANLDKALLKAFKNEKLSIDFYHYFSYVSKLLSHDPQAASFHHKKISPASFLSGKLKNKEGISFLEDSDLYYAFFSPMRSNPLFMIAVLLNVLLIIIFMGIIRKVIVLKNGAKADLCACSTISCPECRVQVGLCNSCLMPLKPQNAKKNIYNIFYPHDKNIIYYASLALPGFCFFYFSEFALAFFYSILLINLFIFNIASAAGFFLSGAGQAALIILVYIIYAVEFSYYLKNRQ